MNTQPAEQNATPTFPATLTCGKLHPVNEEPCNLPAGHDGCHKIMEGKLVRFAWDLYPSAAPRAGRKPSSLTALAEAVVSGAPSEDKGDPAISAALNSAVGKARSKAATAKKAAPKKVTLASAAKAKGLTPKQVVKGAERVASEVLGGRGNRKPAPKAKPGIPMAGSAADREQKRASKAAAPKAEKAPKAAKPVKAAPVKPGADVALNAAAVADLADLAALIEQSNVSGQKAKGYIDYLPADKTRVDAVCARLGISAQDFYRAAVRLLLTALDGLGK